MVFHGKLNNYLAFYESNITECILMARQQVFLEITAETTCFIVCLTRKWFNSCCAAELTGTLLFTYSADALIQVPFAVLFL